MLTIQGEVDDLQITVLVENSVSHNSNLSGVHGLALLVRARSGEVTRNLLVDTGPTARVALANMQRLGVNSQDIDSIVLTHCHTDHTGGLVGIVKAVDRTALPIIAHPSLFRVVMATGSEGSFLRYAGVKPNTRAAVEALGGIFILSSDPITLMNGLGTTGEIPRVTDFENPERRGWSVDRGRVTEDNMSDDMAVVARMEDGMVVITGCSHSGVINTILRAKEVTGLQQVKALAGGFHLIPPDEDRITRAVDELARIDPGKIVAGHCTGPDGQYALRQRFGERFTPLVTGETFQF